MAPSSAALKSRGRIYPASTSGSSPDGSASQTTRGELSFISTRALADAWAAADSRSSRVNGRGRTKERPRSSRVQGKPNAGIQARSVQTQGKGAQARGAGTRGAVARIAKSPRAKGFSTRESRMQESDSGKTSVRMGGTNSRTTAPSSSLAARLVGKKGLIKFLMPVACVLLAVAIIYPAAKDYYVDVRTTAQLQAEYDALNERNAVIENQVAWLNTDAGVEYCARENYGWIKEGEQVMNVTGYTAANSSTVLPTAVVANAVEPEGLWGAGVFDVLFGLEKFSSLWNR